MNNKKPNIIDKTIGVKKSEWIRVMLCQIDFDQLDYEKRGRLIFVKDSNNNKVYLRKYLDIASRNNVDLLVFPELAIPVEFISELFNFANNNNTIVIAGTHYKLVGGNYVSICPIVFPGNIKFETQKINPAADEISSFNEGLTPGQDVYRIHESAVGSFAVAICLDYSNDSLRNDIGLDDLDFLIVPAFNPKSEEFFHTMHSDVQRSRCGLYILYANMISKKLKGDGKSALFAIVEDTFKTEFIEHGCTEENLRNGIYVFPNNKRYCVFELNINHKKPLVGRNSFTDTNVKVIEEDKQNEDNRYDFIKKIGTQEEKYKNIDKYYVRPIEYDEMKEKLEKGNVLIITGDPGIGKTYSAIQLLLEYYNNGYSPIWFYGLSKEDRDIQKESLLNYEPQKKEIVYLEDPFGRNTFENRDELKTIFRNVVQRFRSSNSKLIITSRSEIFRQFKAETLNGEEYESFKNELNIRTPSYNKTALFRIADNYIHSLTDWKDCSPLLINIVHKGIKKGQLISPLMIYNIIRNNASTHTPALIKNAIKKAKTVDLVEQFADEIKHISMPGKILLYLVFLFGRKKHTLYSAIFDKVQSRIIQSDDTKSTINFELKNQDGHRLQKIGRLVPVYGFSHSTYEEALAVLIGKDRECTRIVETCFSFILEENGDIVVDIFRRFILRYPDVVLFLFNELFKEKIKSISEKNLLELSRLMLLSDIDDFNVYAKQIYPINKLVAGLLEDDGDFILILKLRLLNQRKKELKDTFVDWKKVFNEQRIIRMHPIVLLQCFRLVSLVNPNLSMEISPYFKRPIILKKYLLLQESRERIEFLSFFNGTINEGVCREITRLIPDELFSDGKKYRKLETVLKEYMFDIDNVKGEIYVDYGAMMALGRYARLYPIGVKDVKGSFRDGDTVIISCQDTKYSYLAMTDMASSDILRFKGYHSFEIIEMTKSFCNTAIIRPQYRMEINKE